MQQNQWLKTDLCHVIRANFGRRDSNDKKLATTTLDLTAKSKLLISIHLSARTLEECYMFEMGYVHNQLMHQLCSFSRAQSQDLSR